MGKKFIWLAVCCLMALSLVMTSCGSKDEGQTTEQEQVTTPGGPQYGGTITVSAGGASAWSRWDPAYTQAIMVDHMQFTSNELMQGDWTKGPKALGGTGETAWEIGWLGIYDLETGELAESWSTPTPTTIRFKIRTTSTIRISRRPTAER